MNIKNQLYELRIDTGKRRKTIYVYNFFKKIQSYRDEKSYLHVHSAWVLLILLLAAVLWSSRPHEKNSRSPPASHAPHPGASGPLQMELNKINAASVKEGDLKWFSCVPFSGRKTPKLAIGADKVKDHCLSLDYLMN